MNERTPIPVQPIDVDHYIGAYGIENHTTIEALQAHPTLAFLLGRVTDGPQTRDVNLTA